MALRWLATGNSEESEASHPMSSAHPRSSRCPPNENANQLQTTCDNLRSIVAAGRVGSGRRSGQPAFVGCISGLDGTLDASWILGRSLEKKQRHGHH
jgi:hypothetical protein